jgi:hypothetical protein
METGKADRQSIHQASDAYEAWLRTHTSLNEPDLRFKRKALAEGPFPFLRGTFYRWAQLWPALCGDLVGVPVVLGVGDLHVENFGTWRDAEGRLAWGINDFDESYELPYTNDLVRLATSALLAIEGNHISVDRKVACDAILHGYTRGLIEGKPYLIDEENRWFLDVIAAKTAEPSEYWQKFREKITEESRKAGKIPGTARAALMASLPKGAGDIQMSPQRAGVGSLGKPRFVVLAHLLGGPVLREIKALTPSAAAWASGSRRARSFIDRLLGLMITAGTRCPDPFFHVHERWVRRRLAPDSQKIELKAGARTGYGSDLLEAMGRETANVHSSTADARSAIQRDLKRRGDKWLRVAAKVMRDVTLDEHEEWSRTKW